MTAELRKMGADMTETPDGMRIRGIGKAQGNGRLSATTGRSHGDHRVAMALAIAALTAVRNSQIDDSACIETSFPGFEQILLELLKGEAIL
jgi:3-phosphoshikimate 1-carboxyvinyltransferase